MTWWEVALRLLPVPVILLIAGVVWKLIEAKLDKIFQARDVKLAAAYAAKEATERELRELKERVEKVQTEAKEAAKEIAKEAEEMLAAARTDMQTAVGGPGALRAFENRLVDLETKVKLFWGMLERSTADLLLRDPKEK
jgi:hypothetical protein